MGKKIISVLIAICMFTFYMPYDFLYANQKNGTFKLEITETNKSVSGRTDILLDWEAYDFKDASTKYIVARKNLDTGIWEYRGDYGREVIKVLNVYPDIKGSEQLDDWMKSLSSKYDNVNIEVDEVSITDFNKKFRSTLYKNSNGVYNYDVVVFGFWDSYNEKAINKSAASYIQEYIDAGGGVLLGHDTILYGFNAGGFSNAGFNELATKNLNIIPAQSWDYYAVYSNLISVRQQGSVTSYPFDINGMNLSIPPSHTIGQVPLDDDSVYLTFAKNYYPSENDGPYYSYNVGGRPEGDGLLHNGQKYIDNAYLVIKNNVGFIQTGHTSGKSNLPEQMVIANIIYSLTNIHLATNAVDQILDTKRPIKPDYSASLNEISFSSRDEGNSYKYRIMAIPLGANIPTLDNKLKAELDNDSLLESTNGVIKFSNSVEATVGGILKEYEYIVNKSSNMSEVTNGTILGLNEKYKFKLPYEGLTSDTYLHIVAKDKANNKSLVQSIRLWDMLKDIKVKINYQDKKGEKISETKEIQKKYGSVFSPEVKVIIGYNYSNSLPKEEIIVGIDGDEITEVYDKYIEKDIYIATHYELEDKVTANLYNSVYNNYGEEVVFKVANIANKKYLDYYTLGSIDGEKIPTNSNKVTLIWEDDDQAIYAHYKEKTSTATIKFVRADTKEVLATYQKLGYVDDTINIDGDEIADNVVINDLKAYSNYHEVNNTRSIYLYEEPSKNIVTVELKPNKRNITHYGVDYTTFNIVNTTSGSAIKDSKNFEILGTDTVVYTDSAVERVELKFEGVDGWQALDSSLDKEVDFTKPKLTNYLVGYYKGILPSEEYNYTVDYINIVDSKPLGNTYNSGSLHIYDPANIPILEFENIIIEGVNRKVSFEPVSLTITNPDNISRTFTIDEDYGSFIPEVDSNKNFINGNYKVQINYMPFTKISYTDEVYKGDGTTLEKTTTHSVKIPYDKENHIFKETMPLNKYNIVDVKIDGVSIDNPQDYDFSVVADAYDKSIHIVYKQKAYNLDVILIDKDIEGITHTFDTFNNIPIGQAIEFDIPTYPEFVYDGSYTNNNTPESFMTEDNGAITFIADKEGEYEVYLNYREKSIVKIKYLNMKDESIQDSKVDSALRGDTYDISIPSELGYKLMYAYLNGEKYAGINVGETYTINLDERVQEITIYYKRQTYTLTVECSEGGIAFGSGAYFGEDIVSLLAKPMDGYDFVGWEFILQNGATMGKFSDFVPVNGIDVKMPYNNVIIRANFERDDDDDDETESIVDNKDDNSTIDNTINIEIPPELDKLLPFLPELENITKEDIYKLKRENMPYVEGYPDGLIYPNDSITRAEVVQIIYNLYSQGYNIDISVLNRFNDVKLDEWYSEAIAFATSTGVVQGYSDGTFRPNESITRAELVTIIAKFDFKIENEIESNLIDIEESWAKESIIQLVEHGIVNGYENGLFKPNQTATRAEFVKLINRLINRPDSYNVKNTFPDLTVTHWAYSDMMNAANGTAFNFELEKILEYLEEVQNTLKD